ncbi:MAG TPA: carboxypeptidase regulatory-like domain-containing protein [Chthoniobacterales bacterium]
MRQVLQLLIFLAAIAPSLYGQATIEGTVQLPAPSASYGFNQRYGTKADAPTAATNPPAAIVYLEGNFGSANKAGTQTPAVMAQKNMAFAPDLVAVMVGGAVTFPNEDDMYHNVFSYSKVKRFDLGRYRKEEKPVPVVFDKPGAAAIHCDIHDSMRGTVLALETPYFVKTDAAGRYRLKYLPTGRFLLKAWVDGNDVRQRPVELKAGATQRADFPAR